MQDKDIHQSLRIAEIIARRLDHELTPAEQDELSNWLLERDSNRQLLEKIADQQSFERYKDEIESYDSHDALLQVKARIAAFTPERKQKRLWLPVSIAASVLVFFAVGLLWHYSQPPKWVTVSTPYGKVMQVQLPDSSLAWLNAGTTIEYPEAFKGHTRNIKLVNGQVFLNVRHNAGKPFIVQASGFKVTVLGTAFDIKSFAGEKEMRVTVSNGKVGVLPAIGDAKAVMLLPDEQVILNRATYQVTRKKVRSSAIIGWRDGKLSFNEEDFADVISALERKYNVSFKINRTSLYHEKITLQLDDEPLATVLQALSFSNHFKYEQHEQSVIVN